MPAKAEIITASDVARAAEPPRRGRKPGRAGFDRVFRLNQSTRLIEMGWRDRKTGAVEPEELVANEHKNEAVLE